MALLHEFNTSAPWHRHIAANSGTIGGIEAKNVSVRMRAGITASIAGTLEPRLLAAEVERARRMRPDDLTAYDHHLRALAHAHTLTPQGMASALVELRRAIEIDPQFARAHALAA